ncbi:cell wall hydrolase [Bacteroides caecimuris]|uniref:cell wall hydrolase n=2 Tax=Bacteroidales TaxID=171549 RepID=UPI0026470DCE|nr:cell wall hydrolase [Bacteroides caecimuris]
MRKVTMVAALLLSVLMFFHTDVPVEDEVVYASDVTIIHSVIPEPIFVEASPIITEEEEGLLSYEDISLIALVTMAEAEGECEEGKRLVIDTILNRVDSEYFPDNVYDVVYQRSQFSSIWNGRVDRCEVREDICELVREELQSRTNTDVIFFTAGEYSKYGVPMFQVENHYFSSYE